MKIDKKNIMTVGIRGKGFSKLRASFKSQRPDIIVKPGISQNILRRIKEQL